MLILWSARYVHTFAMMPTVSFPTTVIITLSMEIFILLGHLSRENNYEALAYETVCAEVTMGDNPYKAKDFRIDVAHRDTASEVVEV